MRFSTTIVTTLALAPLAGACASESANREPASYQEIRNEELSQERREFIADTRKELDEISNEISRLEARLQHEAQYVEEDERASWSQELFEYKQERDRLRAELERASNASDAEWEEMHGTVPVALDSLEAGITKLSREVSHAFAGDADPSHADSGLCPVEMEGVEAEVESRQNSVALVLTTSDEQRVSDLQKKARTIAESPSYPNGASSKQGGEQDKLREPSKQQASRTDSATSSAQAKNTTPEQQQAIEVSVTAQNIDNGVRLDFVPKNGDLETLRARIERDAERLDEGQCRAKGDDAVSMRQETSNAAGR